MKRTTIAGATVTALTGIAAGRAVRDHVSATREVRDDLARRRIRVPAEGDKRLTVVVPAFREERIGTTVERLRTELASVVERRDLEIVVVDDGSGDATADRAEAAGADLVIRQPVNRGTGAAVRAGVLAAHGRTVAFTDADLAYAPDQIAVLLREIEHGWDIAVGSRRHQGTTTLAQAGLVRQIGSRAINLATRLVLQGAYADTQCGVKAFRADVGKLAFGKARIDGFAFDVELLHLAERYHFSVAQVPVVVANSERSTVRVARDALRLLADLTAIRVLSRRGAYDLGPGESDLVVPNH